MKVRDGLRIARSLRRPVGVPCRRASYARPPRRRALGRRLRRARGLVAAGITNPIDQWAIDHVMPGLDPPASSTRPWSTSCRRTAPAPARSSIRHRVDLSGSVPISAIGSGSAAGPSSAAASPGGRPLGGRLGDRERRRGHRQGPDRAARALRRPRRRARARRLGSTRRFRVATRSAARSSSPQSSTSGGARLDRPPWLASALVVLVVTGATRRATCSAGSSSRWLLVEPLYARPAGTSQPRHRHKLVP